MSAPGTPSPNLPPRRFGFFIVREIKGAPPISVRAHPGGFSHPGQKVTQPSAIHIIIGPPAGGRYELTLTEAEAEKLTDALISAQDFIDANRPEEAAK